jgi:hypothetical protein
MTIRVLRAKETWPTGATGEERQPVPGVESLAASRNFIKQAVRVLRYAGVCSLVARNEELARRGIADGIMAHDH